jgi:hypothetical protein
VNGEQEAGKARKDVRREKIKSENSEKGCNAGKGKIVSSRQKTKNSKQKTEGSKQQTKKSRQ